MSARAYLYDATGTDREVTLNAKIVADLHDQQLLWVDVSGTDDAELRHIASLFSLKRESVYTLLQAEHRPRLDNYSNYVLFNINTIEADNGNYRIIEIDFVLGCNYVLTFHRQPVTFLESFDRRIKGDSDLGDLDAPAFLAALLDWHITGYFRLIEELEKEVDKIDAHALRPRHTRDLLSELAQLVSRIAIIRRTLTPHREVYAAMARPDLQLISGSDSATHYALLADRLERAIDATENTRELLIGSFDMFTTQTTLRTSEVMKVLTLVSFIWFPASVIVGITALLLKSPVHPFADVGFWVMVGSIVLIAVSTIAVARWKHWL